MIARRFARRFGLERRANSSDYWLDGHAQNDRKAPANARVARRCKLYQARCLAIACASCIGIIRGRLHEISGLGMRNSMITSAATDTL